MRITHQRLYLVFALFVALTVVACGGPDEKKAKFFEKGKTLYEKGEFVKARLEFKNAIQIDPKFADAYHMLGMAELKEGNLRQAYAGFSKAAELAPGLLDAQLQLGRIFLVSKHPEKAMEMGKNGRKYFLEHFERKLLTKQWNDMLNEFI